ncbi:lyase family protein [Microbacterium sp. 2FI]|uniref:lyase family protein n=1 Tax=Microbacterium sp. 2FI TaxID=2502193 RepID=UPI002016BA87|nr:lyase family protein [Microbacterium sp. 2FI]
MPSDRSGFDVGLLSPVTVGFDDLVADAAVADALVQVEIALTRAWVESGAAPAETADAIAAALGEGTDAGISRVVDLDPLAAAAVAGGNPVIPLVPLLRAAVPPAHRAWVHRGATSQDILDSAMMLVARNTARQIVEAMTDAERHLTAFARTHRDTVAAARTLGQHAVPTTLGLRAATWLAGIRRARMRLEHVAAGLPAQLGGAAGTLAAFVETATRELGDAAGHQAVERLPALFAAGLRLAVPDAPWHTTRWPVTELGDALVQAIDAAGVVGTDVATGSRTEIGELSESAAGGSSAMPQKQNPAASVLIRSAAVRAPHLGATLHTAAALAGDERPDGAWHAEWQTLRELLRLALGASGTLARLVAGLQVDTDAVARNLGATRGLIVAERLSAALGGLVGADRLAGIIAQAGAGGDLRALLQAEPELAGLDLDDLLDPARYTGLAGHLVDRLAPAPEES